MKEIMLKIIGKQVTLDAEEEQLEFVTEGKYYEKDDSVYLLYDESEFSGMEGCTTSLKITGETIKMKRFGENIGLDTEIEFEKGKRFKGYYDTPFGSVEMEVLTNDVVNNIVKTEGKGKLNIDYNISLRGLSEGRSILDIEII
ncbi:DUF1934 domain-containing protein [Anoxybacterium hadale]|uniref:DUF1934 domain-containing protein n=1 Tax=Anoxybacterium hadale TaxID=3408580 RepID=A0ACD1AES5_9FIRM|nr:DUF1934 domain-containing protein [Clostridiales bacterium]